MFHHRGRAIARFVIPALVLGVLALSAQAGVAAADGDEDGAKRYSDAARVVRSLWFEEIVGGMNLCPARAWDLEDAEACCNTLVSQECALGGRTIWIARDLETDSDFYRGHAYTVLPDHRIRVHRIGTNLLCGLSLGERCSGGVGDDWQVRMDCRALLDCGGGPYEVSLSFRGLCEVDQYCEGSYRARVRNRGNVVETRSGAWTSRLKARWRRPVVDIVYAAAPEDGASGDVPDPRKFDIRRVVEKQRSLRPEAGAGVGIPFLASPFPVPLETDTSTVNGVAAGWIGGEKGLVAAIHENGERMVVIRRGFGEEVPGAVQKVSWVSPSGELLTVFLGADGLPVRAEFGDTVFLFDNYTDETVDITVTRRDGRRTVRRDVPVNSMFMRQLRGFARNGAFRPGADLPEISLLDALRIGAFALGVAGCASMSVVPGLAVPCAAILVERVMAFASSDNELLLETWLSKSPHRCGSGDADACAGAFLEGREDRKADEKPAEADCTLRMISPFGCEDAE